MLGICLAVAVFVKHKEDRGVALSAAFTQFLCGIGEPALYGVVMREKKLIGTMVPCDGIAGLILGISKVGCTNFAFTGLLAFGAWLGAENFPFYCLGIAGAIISGFAITAALLKSGQLKEFE